MNKSPVIISSEGPVGIIELARPEKFNALNQQTLEMIHGAIARFETEGEARAILIRAQGVNFCTGADLVMVGDMDASVGADPEGGLARGFAALCALENSRLPVIAAVQGLCLAGGLELMLACDVVISAASARFGDQHARYGLIPGGGGSQRLPRIIGLRRALDLFYSARWVDAETAMRWGLVNQVVADDALNGEAMAYCTMLAKRNPEGIALMKRLARTGMDVSLEEGLAEERAAVPGMISSANVREGLAAFMARREPDFK